ncbi:laccase [Lactarius indigo]|nr:laccase [Lactarius indigo]
MRLRSFGVALLATVSERVSAFIGPSSFLSIVNANISPDGFNRSSVLAGRHFPRPSDSGGQGRRFFGDVFNNLTDSSMDLVTSIHWHGIFQRTTNFADGGAFVNQCPIIPSQGFSYQFTGFDQAGTFWYHSHFKAQYCDGLRGALVIYDPADPHGDLYDIDNEDTVITLADWYHITSLQAQFPVPDSTLINGKGRYLGGPSVSLAIVNVVHGKRYRLRLVSISCEPAFNFSIDGHQLTVIEVDSVNHQPLLVDSLEIFAGQRYSVVLNANQSINNYWIRAVPNAAASQNFTDLTNLAILRYQGAPAINPSSDPNNIPPSVRPLKETDLHPLNPTPVPGKPVPGGADININLDVSADFVTGKFLVNNVSFESPGVPVLLQILNGAPPSQLLPNGSVYLVGGSNGKNASVEVSIPSSAFAGPVRLQSITELATSMPGPLTLVLNQHPIHLHGHAFHVVRSAGNATYNYNNPVMRDVVSIGNLGDNDNVTFRFATDNPGPWFLHCHIDWHFEAGFAAVFAEDVPEVKATIKPPKAWDDLCVAYNNFKNQTG